MSLQKEQAEHVDILCSEIRVSEVFLFICQVGSYLIPNVTF